MPLNLSGVSHRAVRPGWRNVALLNGTSFLMHLSHFGILYPLLGIWLEAHGMSAGQIGLVLGSVWVGMLAGNLVTPALLTRANARWVATASGLLTGATALTMLQVPTASLAGWWAAATALGFAVGLRWVSLEGWLLALIEGPRRARLISMHESLIYAAQAIGPALIGSLQSMKGAAFHAAAAIAVLAVLPLIAMDRPAPAEPGHHAGRGPASLIRGMWHARRSDSSITVGLLSGVIDGALFGMLSVHLLRSGYDAAGAASMLTLFGLGGLLSQVPLGWLADRSGTIAAGRWLGWGGIAGALLLLAGDSAVVVGAGVVLLGALAACGLSLATIVAAEHARQTRGDGVVAISRVSVVFTVGSAIGPLLAGHALDLAPAQAVPGTTVIACLGLLRWARAFGQARTRQVAGKARGDGRV